MSRKRKYEEVSGFWVYSIYVPSVNKYYIGISKQQCSQRWKRALYENNSLAPYLNEWDSMVKTVLIDNLTKEEAYKYEDNIIQALSKNNLCINEKRSGFIEVSDKNGYQKELRKNNPELREREKQYRESNKEKYREYNKQYYQNKKLQKQNPQIN